MKFIYDIPSGTLPTDEDGKPMKLPRPNLDSLPCNVGPDKCPKGDPSKEAGLVLTPDNEKAVAFYEALCVSQKFASVGIKRNVSDQLANDSVLLENLQLIDSIMKMDEVRTNAAITASELAPLLMRR